MQVQINNGLIWSDGELRSLSMYIDNGKIAALARPESAVKMKADHIIDASGMWILPGGVDMHVHISDGAEVFQVGSRCAAAGGITTVMDMPQFHSCITGKQISERAKAAAADCLVDFGLIAGIVISNDDLDSLEETARAGAAYFKVFQPANPPVSTETLWKAIQKAAATGLRLGLHAEDTTCITPLKDAGNPLSFARSRPAVAEYSAVAQLLEMARAAGAPVHICHVSTQRTVELVARAKADGVNVTCEIPPHFLVLDETAFSVFGARVKTTPPLRNESDTVYLWQALQDGIIDAIACDHFIDSLTPLPDIPQAIPNAPAGIAGLELSLPILMDAVLEGKLSLKRFVEASAETPARVLGIDHIKGQLLPGFDADFVIWNPKSSWKASPQGDFSHIETTPFNGWNLSGHIEQTWLRGEQIWNGETITARASGHWAKSIRGEKND